MTVSSPLRQRRVPVLSNAVPLAFQGSSVPSASFNIWCLKTVKDPWKLCRTGVNLKTLRDAEGTLDPWNAGETQGDGDRKNGDGMVMGRSRSRHKNVSITVESRGLCLELETRRTLKLIFRLCWKSMLEV